MPAKIPVSVLITTLNEEANLGRCLSSLEAFDEIIVIDSHSTDATVDIARSFNVRIEPFLWNRQYPKKRQWALDTLSLKHDRVFFIDADEEASSVLCAEIATLDWTAPGYFVKGLYVVDGQVLRYGLQNKKLCLFDRTRIEFPVVDDLDVPGMGEIEGHYQPVLKAGAAGKLPTLKEAVLHHALDNKARYVERHAGYAAWQAGMAAKNAHPADPAKGREQLKSLFRALPFKRALFFCYFYFARLGILEANQNGEIYRQKQKYYRLTD